MDPTISLAMMKDSFGEIQTSSYPLPLNLEISYKNNSNYEPELEVETGNLDVKYCDVAKFNYLNSLKAKFSSTPEFDRARNKANPFETVSRGFLDNRAGIKFANIDFVFNITGNSWNTFDRKSNRKFTFVDVASGPGSYGQLLQYRFPDTIGVGMTLKGDLDWKPSILDMNKFDAQYGPSGVGDLIADWKWFLSYLMSNYPNINLLMGDGAFEIDDPNRIISQEQVNNELFIVQVVQCLALPTGASGFVKLFDANSDVTAGVLYALSLNFEYITLFKPCTSRPANSERYIVFKNKKAQVSHAANKALYRAASTPGIKKLFRDIPNDFLEYLYKINTIHIDSQIFYCERILNIMAGNKVPEISISTNLIDKLLAIPVGKGKKRKFIKKNQK